MAEVYKPMASPVSSMSRRDEDPRLRLFRHYESRNKQLEAQNHALQRRVYELEAKALAA